MYNNIYPWDAFVFPIPWLILMCFMKWLSIIIIFANFLSYSIWTTLLPIKIKIFVNNVLMNHLIIIILNALFNRILLSGLINLKIYDTIKINFRLNLISLIIIISNINGYLCCFFSFFFFDEIPYWNFKIFKR
jgi:hypothetical protein